MRQSMVKVVKREEKSWAESFSKKTDSENYSHLFLAKTRRKPCVKRIN